MKEFLILSLLAGAGWAVTNVIDDKVIRDLRGDEFVGISIVAAVSRVLLIPIFLFSGTLKFPSFTPVLVSILTGFVFFLGIYFYYVALDIGEIVGLSVFSESGPVVVLVGSLLLGASLTSTDILGVLIIVVGAILVSIRVSEAKKIGIRRETAWIIASTVSFAGVSLLADQVAHQFQSDFAQISWVWVGSIIGGLVYLLLTVLAGSEQRFEEVREVISQRRILLLMIIAIVPETLAYVAFFEAIEIGEVAIASGLSSARPLFVLFFSLFIPSSETRRLSASRILILVLATGLMMIGGYLTLA